MKKSRGIVQTAQPGFYGDDVPHILTYNPNEIWKLLLPCISPHLTVCHHYRVWIKHVSWVVYACVVAVVLANVAFPDTDMGERGNVIPACQQSNPKSNRQMCQLEETMDFWKGEFRFLIAFLLSGFVGASVATWETRRTMYASLCGNVRNLTMKMAAFLPIDKSDEELTTARKILGRWVSLAFELAVLKARGEMDSDMGREHLASASLLHPGEWEAMVQGDRHTTVFWWMHTLLVRLENRGMLENCDLTCLSEAIGSTRGKANDLMSCLDLDKPISYTALCGLLVTTNVFIMSTWSGIKWSIWMRSFGWHLLEQPKFYFDVLGVFSWNLSYKALYELGYILHNPFGKRTIDVAHETIGTGLRTLQEELMDGESHMPSTMLYGTVDPISVRRRRNQPQDHPLMPTSDRTEV